MQNNNTLAKLDLEENDIGPEGATALAEMLKVGVGVVFCTAGKLLLPFRMGCVLLGVNRCLDGWMLALCVCWLFLRAGVFACGLVVKACTTVSE